MRFTQCLRSIAAAAVMTGATLGAPAADADCNGRQGWHGEWGGGGNWDGSRWGYWENGMFIDAGWPHFSYYDSYDGCLGDDESENDKYIGYAYHCDPISPNYDSSYCMGK